MRSGTDPERALPVSRPGGGIEYLLARNAVVSEYRRGHRARHEVCDAHPELLRAARNIGVAREEACPICVETPLVHVTYAFGRRLPAGGRCVTSAVELARLLDTSREVTCFVVEVCPQCAWNHLVRMFPVSGKGSSAGRAFGGSSAPGSSPG